MTVGQIYFWTATINNWNHLLESEEYKKVVTNSLQYLSANRKIDVFAFVIMPNHIHLIWRINEYNGKESPVGSFLKFTAHSFKKILIKEDLNKLGAFKVNAANKSYEFWQRDSLAVHLYSSDVAFQKLDYIHANPVNDRWKLAYDSCDYKYSSAKYYELGVKDFDFIKDLRVEIG